MRAHLVVLVSFVAVAGCATTHGVRRLDALEVHTFRRD